MADAWGAPTRCRVELLGPVRVVDERTAAVRPAGGRQERGVLAILALDAGRAVSVDAIVDGLWGDAPPAGATRSLQTLVARLRRNLAELVAVDWVGASYRLDTHGVTVDVARAEALHRLAGGAEPAEAARHLQAATDLWHGDPLGDMVGLPFAPPAIARLAELRATIVEDLADAELALGRHSALVPQLEARARAEPLRERRWEQLMVALYRSGRQADALEAFRRARAQLVEHAGVEPGEALRALEARILAHDAGLGAPERHRVPPVAPTYSGPVARLPRPATPLIGRDTFVSTVQALVATTRLVTIVGPPGAGKTRAAIEAARRSAPEFQNSVAYVDLTRVEEGADTVAAVLDATGGIVDGDRSQRAALLAHLADRTCLLVIDNCEHVAEAVADLVGELLATAPRVVVVATSRSVLRVDGEHVLPIPPLGWDDASASGVRLYLDRARATGASDPAPEEMAQVALLVEHLDGLPLAIELAAGRARIMAPAAMLSHLDDRFRLLDRTGAGTTSAGRRRALEATIDWSYRLLDGDRQRQLRLLAAFDGPFKVEWAAAVWGVDDLDAADVIDDLTSMSLVDPLRDAGQQAYSLLESIRAFGRRRLAEAGELDDARTRVVDALAVPPEELIDRYHAVRDADGGLQATVVGAAELAAELGNADAAARILAHMDGPDGKAPLRRLDALCEHLHRNRDRLDPRSADLLDVHRFFVAFADNQLLAMLERASGHMGRDPSGHTFVAFHQANRHAISALFEPEATRQALYDLAPHVDGMVPDARAAYYAALTAAEAWCGRFEEASRVGAIGVEGAIADRRNLQPLEGLFLSAAAVVDGRLPAVMANLPDRPRRWGLYLLPEIVLAWHLNQPGTPEQRAVQIARSVRRAPMAAKAPQLAAAIAAFGFLHLRLGDLDRAARLNEGIIQRSPVPGILSLYVESRLQDWSADEFPRRSAAWSVEQIDAAWAARAERLAPVLLAEELDRWDPGPRVHEGTNVSRRLSG